MELRLIAEHRVSCQHSPVHAGTSYSSLLALTLPRSESLASTWAGPDALLYRSEGPEHVFIEIAEA